MPRFLKSLVFRTGPLLLAMLLLLSVTQHRSTRANTDSKQTLTYKETTEYLVNPYMGPVAFAHNRSPKFEGTLVAAGFTWADIEAAKGQYNFSGVEEEQNFRYWLNEKGRQLKIGFSMDYPTLSKTIGYDQIDIPRWLYEELKAEASQTYTKLLALARETGNQSKINQYTMALDRIQNDQKVIEDFNRTMADTADIPGVGTFYRFSTKLADGGVEYQVGFSPNYASPLLINYHATVMQALANRYDNDKTYAIIMGSVGHWGEMHTTFIRNTDNAGHYPGIAITTQYEEAYAKCFKNTIVSSRFPRQVALDNNFGLHNHAFGDPRHTYDWFVDLYSNGYTDYYTGDLHPAMPDFWKTAPSGAEFLYTGDYRFLTDSYIVSTLKQAEDTYLTWLVELWYDLSPEAERNMQRLMAKIGYRFVITEASFNTSVPAGGSIELTTKWRNSGTAPFYYDWPIVAQLQTAQGTVVAESMINDSVRNLFPGTTEEYDTLLKIPADAEPGTYQLWVGIFNPETGQAAINLAVKDMQEHNRMRYIGDIEINN